MAASSASFGEMVVPLVTSSSPRALLAVGTARAGAGARDGHGALVEAELMLVAILVWLRGVEVARAKAPIKRDFRAVYATPSNER